MGVSLPSIYSFSHYNEALFFTLKIQSLAPRVLGQLQMQICILFTHKFNATFSGEFAFWSRVEGNQSRVEGKWSRVEGNQSRVEGNQSRVKKFFTIIFERRQIKISCLLEFPVSVYFTLTPSSIMYFLFPALLSWNKLTFLLFSRVILQQIQKDTDRTEGGVRVCGDAVWRYFWCGFAVILILTCGIAVSKH